jgi:hypothetical protein
MRRRGDRRWALLAWTSTRRVRSSVDNDFHMPKRMFLCRLLIFPVEYELPLNEWSISVEIDRADLTSKRSLNLAQIVVLVPKHVAKTNREHPETLSLGSQWQA